LISCVSLISIMPRSGWDPALQRLIDAIKEHRPDGVLGFSQGAAAGALLLSCLCTEEAAGQLEEAGVQPPRCGRGAL
jgi:hypothetical protein